MSKFVQDAWPPMIIVGIKNISFPSKHKKKTYGFKQVDAHGQVLSYLPKYWIIDLTGRTQ